MMDCQVNVQAYGPGGLLYNNNYTLNATAPTFINFGYLGLMT